MSKFLWGLAIVGAATAACVINNYVDAQEGRPLALGNQPEPPPQTEPETQDPFAKTPILNSAPQLNSVPQAKNDGVNLLRYERTRPRQTEQKVQLKNYHKELFGTERPTSQAPRPLAQPRSARPLANQKQTPIGNPPAVSGLPTKSGVVTADHSGSNKNPILQTSGSQPAPMTLPEFPSTETVRPISRSSQASQSRRSPQITNFTKENAQVTTEWHILSDINVGQTCKLELHVENVGQAAASNVVVEAYFPASVRLKSTQPKPTAASEYVSWNLPGLNPGQKQIIQIEMIPSRRGDLNANANVRYTTAATTVLKVKEPMLKLAVAGPKEVRIGEQAAHVVTVSNPGTGVAHNVTVEVAIPSGLEHSRGKRLKMDVGSLGPGESRRVRLPLIGKAGGKHTLTVLGKSGSELSKSASADVTVLAPSLSIDVAGPALRYVGRDARYSVTVTNNGKATTSNVRALYAVPKGFEFVSATRGGKFDARNRTVTWFIGTIDAAKNVEFSLKLRPTAIGEFAHVARASSEHGAVANGQTITTIEGTASLDLKVADLDDPVEIGKETGYQITVKNNGSKAASNVGLSIELPLGVKLVKATGPSQHIAESGLVVFRSMPSIAPGKTAKYQLIVTGQEEGNQRLRARLTSSSIQEPLTVEELTRFYAE